MTVIAKASSQHALFDLTGKTALITGGNRGLGLSIAKGLASAGANIAIAARDEKEGDRALSSLQQYEVKTAFIQTDVSDAAACANCVEKIGKDFDRLDILVNNAGISIRKEPQDISLEEWQSVIDINLTAPFVFSNSAYQLMKASGGGKIINIGSLFSLFGASFAAPYCASKGGIVQLTKALATAWAKDGIQVNAILPGWHETDLTERARSQVNGLQDSVKDRTPMGRWGTPDDIAGAAMFLASAASNFVTGASISVDGGFSAQG